MAYEKALIALADPTRRQIVERLRRGPAPVSVISQAVPVSRPAVSQHLKALREAGLVQERAEGTRRVYALRPDGLAALRRWLDLLWDDALLRFQTEVERQPQEGEIDE